MAKFPIVEVVKAAPSTVANFVAANEGTILPVGSIVFSGVAIVAAVKNSNDILSIIGDANDALKLEADPEMRKKIYVSAAKDLAPKVGPIVIFYGASIACTIVNKKHTDKKIAELTAALGLAQTAITQYQLWQKQAEQELGDKVEVVNKAVAEEVVKNDPPTDKNAVNNPSDYVQVGNKPFHYYMLRGNHVHFWDTKSPSEMRMAVHNLSIALSKGETQYDHDGRAFLSENDLLYVINQKLVTHPSGDMWGFYGEDTAGKAGEPDEDAIYFRVFPMENPDQPDDPLWAIDYEPSRLF